MESDSELIECPWCGQITRVVVYESGRVVCDSCKRTLYEEEEVQRFRRQRHTLALFQRAKQTRQAIHNERACWNLQLPPDYNPVGDKQEKLLLTSAY